MKIIESREIGRQLTKDEYKNFVTPLKSRLARLSQEVSREKLPVIVLVEGFGASGKGSLISELILNWDPRGFRVYNIGRPEPSEIRRPWLYRFWLKLPEYGKIAVLDRSWYTPVTVDRVDDDMNKNTFNRMINDINVFERQLTDDGYCVIKVFLHISATEQKERFERLMSSPETSWRVTSRDLKHNEQYKQQFKAFSEAIERTDTENAPWYVVDAEDYRYRNVKTFEIVADAIEKALEKKRSEEPVTLPEITGGNFKIIPAKKLEEYDLTKTISDDSYKKILKNYQDELSKLHNKLYMKKITVVICYEGWDAAGKGGNIKRIARSLDARGYDVIPIAAPTKLEIEHHYLWRFWRQLPKDGHIAIFDRTWYGRVMVERIEGFCTEIRWRQAYQEMNEFEKMLYDRGTVILKFWLHIDKDEQLRRFRAREETEEKRWKINEEDWRNRDKWDLYEVAVDDMLTYTSTDFAPWHVIESNDKKYARLKTMKILVDTLHEALDEK